MGLQENEKIIFFHIQVGAVFSNESIESDIVIVYLAMSSLQTLLEQKVELFFTQGDPKVPKKMDQKSC